MNVLNLAQFENEYEIGAFVLDFRPGEQFAQGFVPGAYYISPVFFNAPYFSEIIPANETVVTVSVPGQEHTDGGYLERRMFENLMGTLKGGFATWAAAGNKIDVVISIEADELMMDMKYDSPQVIDIRDEEAYNTRHLADAENIPAQNLLYNIEELPKDGVYYLYCDDGDLSLSIISCLKNHGLHNYYHVQGGFRALMQYEAPME